MRALVTGAGHRLGRAMALYLAGRGYDVAVHYASSDKGAQESVAAIEDLGQKAVALQADLTDEASTQALFPAAPRGPWRGCDVPDQQRLDLRIRHH